MEKTFISKTFKSYKTRLLAPFFFTTDISSHKCAGYFEWLPKRRFLLLIAQTLLPKHSTVSTFTKLNSEKNAILKHISLEIVAQFNDL